MANLQKQIQNWKDAGIISETQGSRIWEYEENHKPKNLGAYSIIVLGAVVICIGIISLIAANWDEISGFYKLLIDFILLGSVAYSIYRTVDLEKKFISEILIVVFSLLCLGSIGLISQVFHTGGELYQALGFWCIIMLPIVLQSSGRFNKHFWLLSFLYSISLFVETNFYRSENDNEFAIFLMLAIPSFLFLISKLLESTSNESLQVMGSAGIFWGTVTMMIGSVFISFFDGKMEFQKTGSLYAIIVFYILSLLFTLYAETKEDNKKAAIFLAGGIIYILYVSSHIFDFHGKFLDAVFFVLVWFSLAFYFNVSGSRKLFEFAITIIGLRFLVVYFELFASLALTGFGLIVSGIFIILACLGYIKYRKNIFAAIEGIL
jgi:uncharacterized membrane protein